MKVKGGATNRFAPWLRRQLERRGWSGSELARKMDILPGTVNNWARGDRTITDPALIQRMAAELNVHVDEILEQLDLRDGEADHMSVAVRRFQPLIDSIDWDEAEYRMIENILESIRDMKRGTFDVPDLS